MATHDGSPGEPTSQSRSAAATRRRKTPTPTLLCVDDDPGVVAALELRLRQYDLRVLCACTGMQGYWQAALHRPDVIVTDLRMPLGGGNYLLECLRRNPETVDIPVLVLSGLSARSLSGRVELLGAAALLQKPICSEELIENIAKFIPLREREGIKPTQVRRP